MTLRLKVFAIKTKSRSCVSSVERFGRVGNDFVASCNFASSTNANVCGLPGVLAVRTELECVDNRRKFDAMLRENILFCHSPATMYQAALRKEATEAGDASDIFPVTRARQSSTMSAHQLNRRTVRSSEAMSVTFLFQSKGSSHTPVIN